VLSTRLEFVPARDAELFAAVPAGPAVFLFQADDPQSEPYVSKTANLRRRLQRLLSAPTEHSKKLNLRDRARWIEFTPTGSDFESGLLLYKVLRSSSPRLSPIASAFGLPLWSGCTWKTNTHGHRLPPGWGA